MGTITTSSVFLKALSSCGVTYAFVNWGSDHPGLLEDLERQRATEGTNQPTIVTCPNEMVALSCAQGYAQVTGKPALCIVHVDVGTLAMAGAIHNVDRARTPVIIYAGASPFSLNREHKAGRNEWIMGMQDIPDQTSIVRQYMRAVLQINSAKTVATTVKRAVQIATSTPKGPVYLWGRREVMEEDVDLSLLEQVAQDLKKWPSIQPPGLSSSSMMDITQLLVTAKSPLILTSHVGRNPSTIPHLTKLSTLLSIPIFETCPSTINVPFSHPYNVGVTFLAPGTHTPLLKSADVVLVIDSHVPWIRGAGDGSESPREDAKVIFIDSGDPLQRSSQTWHVEADIICLADAQVALEGLVGTVKQVMERSGAANEDGGGFGERIVKRGIEMEALHEEMVEKVERAEQLHPDVDVGITPANIMGVLRKALEPYKVLFLAEGISNYPTVWAHLKVETPGSMLTSGGSSLGWGIGSAVGAFLGTRDEKAEDGKGKYDLVVSVVGDGSFLFGVPSSLYWMARKYQTPFLTIILNNGGWKSPKLSMQGVYPQGLGTSQPGHRLTVGFGGPDIAPPDYSAIAVAASAGWARGWKVVSQDSLVDTMKQAVDTVVGEKRCAVLDCVVASI
ncbi:thiamine pyrophosphate enzyme, N-terminal TPP binding domain-containing protein [Flagelloscypha sp. PMI_526]|nr:thiamine pyrophosphate enzyme, N-terminal TPP binding domain-containing protein [Flagelloscypha sp. PMI_526]